MEINKGVFGLYNYEDTALILLACILNKDSEE